MNPEINEESVKGMDDVMDCSQSERLVIVGPVTFSASAITTFKCEWSEYSTATNDVKRRQGFEPFDYTERS